MADANRLRDRRVKSCLGRGLHVNLRGWLFLMQESYTVNPDSKSEGDRPSPYKGGLFRVSIKLPDSYPAEPPQVCFCNFDPIHVDVLIRCIRGQELSWHVWNTLAYAGSLSDTRLAPPDRAVREALRGLFERPMETYSRHSRCFDHAAPASGVPESE